MKEINFRVWDDIAKIMSYPCEAKYCVTMVGSICIDETDDGGKLENVSYRTTAMQYTGLKDDKGVDIYEGDVVPLSGYGDYLVEFPFLELYDAAAENDICSIKGNIYENPELAL